MKWTTPVDVTPCKGYLQHGSPMLLMGSCFAHNVGALLADAKFNVCLNPYGTLYNPESIACAIDRLMERRPFTEDELQTAGDLCFSYMHHGDFSHDTPQETLAHINERYLHACYLLPRCERLIVTWGTAHVYRLAATGRVVANCHKQPATTFSRSRLSVNDIVTRWDDLTTRLRAYAPRINILLTVSPIRHLRDGAHPNQLSKATLLLAADELAARHNECYTYFPAYEIVMDELRDYRYYAHDLTHPAQHTVAYIYERLADAYFTPATATLAARCERVMQGVRHRPLKGTHTAAYRDFATRLLREMEAIERDHPEVTFTTEKNLIINLIS